MPWLDKSNDTGPAAQKWHVVFKNALHRRLSPEEISSTLEKLYLLYWAAGEDIANALVGFRSKNGEPEDPLLLQYAEHILKASYMGTADLLWALLTHSQFSGKQKHENSTNRSCGLPSGEERIFALLTQMHMAGVLRLKPIEIPNMIHALCRWLHATCEHEMGKQLESAGLHALDPFMSGIYDSLGSLTLTILEKPDFRAVSKQPWWKQRRALVLRELQNFDMHVLQWMQSHLAGRLQGLTKMPPFVELAPDGHPNITERQILDSVSDLPVLHTRAGLYIWLNACLCGRPLTDDLSMLGYLQARYSGDNQTLLVDLVTACFDVLTNSILREEHYDTAMLIRSFLCNKVPLLLAALAGYLTTMTAEACIQMAFMTTVTMDVLPPISGSDKEIRETLKRARLEFLQACALHGLLSENTICSILQEPATTLPKITRYTKDGLVAQCTTNINRLESLLEELRNMQGNAGAIACCIVQVINNLCISKDTMSLKTVCSILIKQIEDLDVIMQHTQPVDVLVPLCILLNDWTHDQDQVEFTPSYEEFASILLFTLAFIHRFSLSKADADVLPADTFVFHLIHHSSDSIEIHDLNEEQNGQLSKWIEGLFATDEHGETSGVGDDVMRQCAPQDFYKLVPTLFQQCVLACRSNYLSMTTFKGGLELLLEPFLLPSLVNGLSWLIKHSWEDHGDADMLLQIFDKLLKPSSTSQETQEMHKAVLSMVAIPLTRSLQELLRKRPDKRATAGLIGLLKPYTQQVTKRTSQSSRADIREWAATEDGGFLRSIRNTVRDLVSWIPSNPPPRYTHKQFLAACGACGVDSVLAALVAELRAQTAMGNGAQALDVCVTMVCAPSAATIADSGLSMRDHLQFTISETEALLNKPALDSEALVRMARRVEAQLTLPQLQLPIPSHDQAADQMMQDLGLSDGDGANATDAMAIDHNGNMGEPSVADLGSGLGSSADPIGGTALDLSNMGSDNVIQINNPPDSLGFGIDMGQGQDQQGQDGKNDLQNQEEDIFAGIDMGGDLGDYDFNFS